MTNLFSRRIDGDYPKRLAEYICAFYNDSNRWPTNSDELRAFYSPKAGATNLVHYCQLQLATNSEGALNVQYIVKPTGRMIMVLPKPK